MLIIVDKFEQLAQLPIELRLVQVPSIRNVLEAVARHSLSSCVLLSLCFPSEAGCGRRWRRPARQSR